MLKEPSYGLSIKCRKSVETKSLKKTCTSTKMHASLILLVGHVSHLCPNLKGCIKSRPHKEMGII